MRGAAKKAAVEGASEELERRSQYLSSLIHRTKVKSEADQDKKEVVEQRQPPNVKVRASDMPLALQKRAFKCARETLASMPRLESKRLACALKKARFFPLYFLFNYLM
ncbi:Dynein light chain type 1 [Musa troglodytarum]|uniref:Dynein light chain type 1 n=1 Tax=Musa troglodytarum TaxID=320322 RepID=A0A9E7GUL9_9LILI|nr:Dynein light chain type 1 [Musa troglodytarum]